MQAQLPRRSPAAGHPPPVLGGGRRASVLWFRSDLRLHDHEALAAALRESPSVLPLYCFDPREYGKVTWEGKWDGRESGRRNGKEGEVGRGKGSLGEWSWRRRKMLEGWSAARLTHGLYAHGLQCCLPSALLKVHATSAAVHLTSGLHHPTLCRQ